MHMGTGSSATLPKSADDLAYGHFLAIRRAERRQVAIKDAHMRVDRNHHVNPRTAWIYANFRNSRGCGMDRGSQGRREVDACVDMATGAKGVIWFQGEARATERLADDRPRHDGCQWKALMARDLRADDHPDHSGGGHDPDDANGGDHALASACSMW